jgi:hypothetical protein
MEWTGETDKYPSPPAYLCKRCANSSPNPRQFVPNHGKSCPAKTYLSNNMHHLLLESTAVPQP